MSTITHTHTHNNNMHVCTLMHHTHTVHHNFSNRGLVPLHNACSYGHYEVTELLVKYRASVNVVDHWKYTPLHEAAAKGKYEICKLLLKVRDKGRKEGKERGGKEEGKEGGGREGKCEVSIA